MCEVYGTRKEKGAHHTQTDSRCSGVKTNKSMSYLEIGSKLRTILAQTASQPQVRSILSDNRKQSL